MAPQDRKSERPPAATGGRSPDRKPYAQGFGLKATAILSAGLRPFAGGEADDPPPAGEGARSCRLARSGAELAGAAPDRMASTP